MHLREYVEARISDLHRAHLEHVAEQVTRELGALRSTLEARCQSLASALASSPDEQLVAQLVADLVGAAAEQAERGAQVARAQAMDDAQNEIEQVRREAAAQVEAARSHAQSQVRTETAARLALTEALEEARAHVRKVQTEAHALIERARAELLGQLETERVARRALQARLDAVRKPAEAAQAAAPALVTSRETSPPPGPSPEDDASEGARHESHPVAAGRSQETLSGVTQGREGREVQIESDSPVDPGDLSEAFADLDEAPSSSRAVDALLGHLAPRVKRAVLFIVASDRLVGWRRVDADGSTANLQRAQVPLTTDCPLTRAARTRMTVVTAGHLTDRDEVIFGSAVRFGAVVPLIARDGPVAVLAAELPRGPGEIASAAAVESLVARAARRMGALLALAHPASPSEARREDAAVSSAGPPA